MRDIVIGTAGHIDHGKTLLVKALTGMDADRLEEEKRRGITLDVGFAVLHSGEARLHFVDLPGHEKFIKNMLAGATGVDLFLLVVAADESIMPQTVEHLEIMRLLGVKRGVAALNKIDAVDGEMRELALLELQEFLEKQGFDEVPVFPVSARTGEGVDSLKARLLEEAQRGARPSVSRPFRLPVDRVFPVKGFGTVVTGTCISGTLSVGARVELHPGALESKVRGLHVFGSPVESVRAGQRSAVNIPDIPHHRLSRGFMAAEPGALFPSRLLDARVEVLASARVPLRDGMTCGLHIHTLELEARLHLASIAQLAPGASGIVQIRLKDPVAAWPGDRFILRLPDPARTVAGGEVLLPARRRARWNRPRDRRLLEILASAGPGRSLQAALVEAGPAGCGDGELKSRLGLSHTLLREAEATAESAGAAVRWSDSWRLDPLEAEAWIQRALAWLESRHDRSAARTWIPRPEFLGRWSRLLDDARAQALLDVLAGSGKVEMDGDRVRLAGHRRTLTKKQERLYSAVLALLGERSPAPMSAKDLERETGADPATVLDALTEEERVVKFGGGFYMLPEGLDAVIERLLDRAAGGSEMLSVPEFKDLFGITRKYAMPLLEYLDDLGVTRREGDGRRIAPPAGKRP